jgi:hypothetical protein
MRGGVIFYCLLFLICLTEYTTPKTPNIIAAIPATGMTIVNKRPSAARREHITIKKINTPFPDAELSVTDGSNEEVVWSMISPTPTVVR